LGLYAIAKHLVANKPFVCWIRFCKAFSCLAFFWFLSWGLGSCGYEKSFEYGIPGLGILLVIIVGLSFVLYNN